MEPETSSTTMMSIPLASTCVRLFPSCGRAIAIVSNARLTSSIARRNLPARAALLFPSARNVAVDENVSAAAGPLLPRQYASSGMASSSNSSHGCAKVRAEFIGNQSRRFKFPSFDEPGCLLQKKAAVFDRRVVTGEFDQVATIQEVFEQ